MANTVFKLRRSSVAGKVPNTSTVAIGELAINLTDKKLFSSDGSAVFEIGANLSNLQVSNNITTSNINVTDTALFQNVAVFHDIALLGSVSANSSNGSSGLVLTSNGSGVYWAPAGGSATGPLRQQFTGDGNTTTFTITGGYESNTLSVYLNGVMLHNGLEANVQSGTNVVISPAPANGTLIDVVGYSVITSTSFLTIGNTTLAGNLISIGNSSVNTQIVPGNVYLNGSTLVIGNTSSNITINDSTISVGGVIINTTSFSGVSNNTLYVGSVAAANVVSDVQLSDNVTTINSNLTANVNLLSNNISTLESLFNANVVTITNNISTSYSNSINYTDSKIYTANVNIVANASAAYSNSVTYTDGKIATANLAIANAYSNAVSYTDSKIATANAEIANALSIAINNSANAYSNAVSYTDSKIATANLTIANVYSNAVLYTDNAYSNAISYINSSIGTANAAMTANAASAYSNATSYTDTKIGTANSAIVANASAAYSNAVSYTDGKIATANSAIVANASAAYSNAVSYTDGKIATANAEIANALSIAINNSANAYTNATTFASNASNISSGTVAEARLPYRLNQNLRNTDTVEFNGMTLTGNLVVSGNVNIIGANNLSLVDNMIYLNSNSTVTNPDIGISGNYNTNGYAHTGIFRDATDGFWKVYDNYGPEPDASPYIDTSNTTFHIANFWANTIYVGNTSVYATVNTTSFTGTANNASYLGGTAAASYLLSSTAASTYLPLSGGTVSGTLIQQSGYAYFCNYNSGPGTTYPTTSQGLAFASNFTNGQAEVDIWNTNDPVTYSTTGIRFIQKLTSSTYRDLMFLRQDGNVGIACTAPEALLDMGGSITTTNTVYAILARPSGGDGNFKLTTTTGSGTTAGSEFCRLSFKYGSATTYHNAGIGFYRGGDVTGGFMTFNTNAWTEAMRIDASQYVGIGTTPSHKLDVSGNINTNQQYRISAQYGTELGSSEVGFMWHTSGPVLTYIGANDYIIKGSGADKFRVYNSGPYTLAYGSMRSPIFYDSDDTGYYVNPNNNSIMTRVYASYFCGLGGNAYGIYKGYDNNNHFIGIRCAVGGTTSSPTYTGAHQTTFVEYATVDDGTGWFFKTAGTGNYDTVSRITRSYSYFESSVRSPLFYDSNDTSYYCDPTSTSVMYKLQMYYRIVMGNGNNDGRSNGIWHWSDADSNWVTYMAQPTVGINPAGTTMTGGYWDNGHQIRVRGGAWGFEDYGSGNCRAHINGTGAWFAGQTRSPIFYDSDNTAYYFDGNGSTVLYRLTVGTGGTTQYNESSFTVYGGATPAITATGGWGRYGKAIVCQTDGGGGQDGPMVWFHKQSAKSWGCGVRPYSGDNGFWISEDSSGSAWGTERFRILPGGQVNIFAPDGGWNARPALVIASNGDGYLQTRHIRGKDTSGTGVDNLYIQWEQAADVYLGRHLHSLNYYDRNDTNYYLDPNGGSTLSTLYHNGATAYFRGGQGVDQCCGDDGAVSIGGNSTKPPRIAWHSAGIMEGTIEGSGTGWRKIYFYDQQGSGLGVHATGQIASNQNVIAYYSDRRLKKDFDKVTDHWNVINNINGYRFTWNETAAEIPGFVQNVGKREVGLIAQEVLEVYPEAVYTRTEGPEDDPYKTILHDRFNPIFIEALKDLHREIAELKAEIKELKNGK